MRRAWLLALVGLGTVLPAGAQSKLPPPVADRADSLTEALFARSKSPGLSIAVLEDHGVGGRFQLGTANRETGARVRRETTFRIGSISKLFTAAIAARLAAHGTLDLDAPISRYLPDLPETYGRITARQLAGHLGGVRHYGPGEFISTKPFTSIRPTLDVFLRDTLVAAPGSRYFYSSYGFNLLGAVLEAAGRAPYGDLLRREVIEPLRLNRTALEATPAAPDQAVPYSADNAGALQRSPAADLSDRWPSGGIVSTPEDLVRFALGVTGPDYLPEPVRTLFLTPQHTAAGAATIVGLGWRIATDSAGRRYLHHGGSSLGGRGFLLVYPAERVAVAILSNTEANLGEGDALAFARIASGRLTAP